MMSQGYDAFIVQLLFDACILVDGLLLLQQQCKCIPIFITCLKTFSMLT